MPSKPITTAAIMLIIGGGITTLAFMFGDIGNPSQNSSNKNAGTSQSEKQATSTTAPDKEQYKELTFPNNTLDTSDWETYRNEKFGFAVNYPEGWEVEFFGVKNNTPYGTAGEGFSESGYGGELKVYLKGVRDSDNAIRFMRVLNRSLQEQIERHENNEIMPGPGVKRYIKVNNAFGIETKDFETPMGSYVPESYILEGTDNITYEFDGLNAPKASEYRSEIEQMLLSFRVIK